MFLISFMLYQSISCTSLKLATHTTIYTWLDGITIILRGSGTQAEYNSVPFVWLKAVGSSQFYELFRNKQVDAYVSSSEHY